MDVDRRVIVLSQKGGQPAAVVIVSVGQKRAVNTGNVQPQRVRVAQKQFTLSEVEQQVLALGLKIKTQSMLTTE